MHHIVGWICLLAAAGVFAGALNFMKRVSSQATWREGRGRITQSDVVNQFDTYKPEIRYEYAVNGAMLVGTKVRSRLLQYNWRSPADRLCARYTIGSEHKVFINAADPTDAILETGGDHGFFILAFGMVALLAVTGFVLLLSK